MSTDVPIEKVKIPHRYPRGTAAPSAWVLTVRTKPWPNADLRLAPPSQDASTHSGRFERYRRARSAVAEPIHGRIRRRPVLGRRSTSMTRSLKPFQMPRPSSETRQGITAWAGAGLLGCREGFLLNITDWIQSLSLLL